MLKIVFSSWYFHNACQFHTCDPRFTALFNNTTDESTGFHTSNTADLKTLDAMIPHTDATKAEVYASWVTPPELVLTQTHKNVVVEGKHSHKAFYLISAKHSDKEKLKEDLKSLGLSSYAHSEGAIVKMTDANTAILQLAGDDFGIAVINFLGTEYLRKWFWSLRQSGVIHPDTELAFTVDKNAFESYERALIGFR